MFEFIKSLLASSDPATLVGSAAVAVWCCIYLLRRFRPSAWHWIEARFEFALAIDSDAIFALVWKSLQALPGTLLGATMTALASGGDLKKTLLGALAGPVAAIGHEVIKRYKGSVKGAASAVLLALVLSSANVGCAGSQRKVCNPALGPVVTAKWTASMLKLCKGYDFDTCPAKAEIDAEFDRDSEAACPQ